MSGSRSRSVTRQADESDAPDHTHPEVDPVSLAGVGAHLREVHGVDVDGLSEPTLRGLHDRAHDESHAESD